MFIAGCVMFVSAACFVPSWQWDWNYVVEEGYDAGFRGASGVCGVSPLNEIDGRELETLLRRELGFESRCLAGAGRYLEVELWCAPGASSMCDGSATSATGRVRVIGPAGVEVESTWMSLRCGVDAEEYARSFAYAVRGVVIFGRNMPRRVP